jgi:hypothetical protein
MRGYYVVHDLDTLKFGLTPTTASTKELITAGSIPAGTPKPYPRLSRYAKYTASGTVLTTAGYLMYKNLLVKSPFTIDPSVESLVA